MVKAMKIGVVPYINALPLVYRLEDQLVPIIPSQMPQALQSGEVDVALMPTFGIIKNGFYMHPQAGVIGCEGPVKSVGLFTRSYIESLDQIQTIYLDQESLTSTYLTKVILKEYLGKSLYDLEFLHHDKRDLADAQLLIGDKALFHKHNNSAQYHDLGELWQKYTGHGFIFASWASTKPLCVQDLQTLMNARYFGQNSIDKILSQQNPQNQDLIHEYLTQNIQYQMTESMKQGFQKYYELISKFEYNLPRPKQSVA